MGEWSPVIPLMMMITEGICFSLSQVSPLVLEVSSQ